MRILVCGGRNYDDTTMLGKLLDGLLTRLSGDMTLIHGACSGADTLAGRWATANGVMVIAFPANWSAYGPAAGPVRNQEMLLRGRPDLVVAFKGGTGTKNMVAQARKAGVRVVEVMG